MSTKITKGARLHLLRVVERMQYPMLTGEGEWFLFTPGARSVYSDVIEWASAQVMLAICGPTVPEDFS